jgi:hypothetical protein
MSRGHESGCSNDWYAPQLTVLGPLPRESRVMHTVLSLVNKHELTMLQGAIISPSKRTVVQLTSLAGGYGANYWFKRDALAI